jgi:hypothetical protein
MASYDVSILAEHKKGRPRPQAEEAAPVGGEVSAHSHFCSQRWEVQLAFSPDAVSRVGPRPPLTADLVTVCARVETAGQHNSSSPRLNDAKGEINIKSLGNWEADPFRPASLG